VVLAVCEISPADALLQQDHCHVEMMEMTRVPLTAISMVALKLGNKEKAGPNTTQGRRSSFAFSIREESDERSHLVDIFSIRWVKPLQASHAAWPTKPALVALAC
jgi:hypothetical protein